MENREQQILSEIKSMMASIRSQLERLDAKMAELQQVVDPEEFDMAPIDIDIDEVAHEEPVQIVEVQEIPMEVEEPVEEVVEESDEEVADLLEEEPEAIEPEEEPVDETEPESELEPELDTLVKSITSSFKPATSTLAFKPLALIISLMIFERFVFLKVNFPSFSRSLSIPLIFKSILSLFQLISVMNPSTTVSISDHLYFEFGFCVPFFKAIFFPLKK